MRIDNNIKVTPPKKTEPIFKDIEKIREDNPNLARELKKDSNEKNELNKAIELLNNAMKIENKRLQFEIHEGTERTMVKVINRENDEIIREIPSEEILDLVERMTELVGIMMDKRV